MCKDTLLVHVIVHELRINRPITQITTSTCDEMSPEEKADATGRYFLPRNVEEAERMQNQHEWLKGGANGLVLAPIDLKRRGMRVLDAATADGKSFTTLGAKENTKICKVTGCKM